MTGVLIKRGFGHRHTNTGNFKIMDEKGQQSKQYRDILKHKDRAYPILFGIISDL